MIDTWTVKWRSEMKTILALILASFILGSSAALATDYSTANAGASGVGYQGSASTSTLTNTATNGVASADAAAGANVCVSNSGWVKTAGKGDSASVSFATPSATIGVSHSAAVSYTAVVSDKFGENSGGNGIYVGSSAKGTGTAANAGTYVSGTGVQASVDSQVKSSFAKRGIKGS